MEKHHGAEAVCSVCHAPLHTDGSCPACLLRGGLFEETQIGEPPDVAATVYGDFEIARREDGSLWELGHGAMGVTYKAIDRVLHRPVALKVIQFGPTATSDDDLSKALRERFLREARAAAALRHTNIAGVFHFGATHESGRCYYAMELVEGETLEARVCRDGPIDAATTLEIASQVAAALVAAASRGLIHRDLKPSNLMLSAGSPSARLEVKVIDFGLAKAGATAGEIDLTHGGFVGTPAYASPEQFERKPVDARTDIYSLGVTLWYALTGQSPFTGRNLDELRYHPARIALPVEQLTAKKIPPAFVALLRAMLAENPAERPASARELVAAIEDCRLTSVVRGARSAGGSQPMMRTTFAVCAALGVASVGIGLAWWLTPPPPPNLAVPVVSRPTVSALPVIPEKSLAVLPFDNFSVDKDSAFFADGVQDEVLTDLAKVADLKVISRTSVMPYQDPAKRSNLREIGQALGVAYVVEGSVQRAGDRIRVNVKLIDARTDTQRWSDRYDRDLQDVFAIQSEIAQSIADKLSSNVSPAEKVAISEQPTANLAAYSLYTEAQGIFIWNDSRGAHKAVARKAELLREAIQADSGFALAYCLLAKVECDFFEASGDRAHLDLAKQAAETALQLRPNMGEAHRELARYYFHANENEQARAEVAMARRLLPNDAEVFRIEGEAASYQGRWEDALAAMQKGFELDPKGGEVSWHVLEICQPMRRYRLWEQTLRQIAATHGLADEYLNLSRAEMERDMGNLTAAQADIAKVPLDFDPISSIPLARYSIALFRRDYDAAERALAAPSIEREATLDHGHPPESWWNGLIAQFRGDETKAQAVFAAARKRLDVDWGEQLKNEQFFAAAARLDAGLGRKEEAIREAQQAVELVPISRNAVDGPDYVRTLALVYARTDEPDLAIRQLEIIAKIPGGPAYGELRYAPFWDSLRKDPRFDAIVASLAPKP